MFTQPQVWQAIDELARRRHWTVSRLAVRAHLDATALNPSKRIGRDGKPRWPSTHTIAQLLEATGTSLCDFSALIESSRASEGLADILLVDDSADQRQDQAALLPHAGYRVYEAENHRAAFDLIEREPTIDLLCTDIVMPNGQGGAALARFAQARLPGLKVIYLTAYDLPALSMRSDLCLLRKPVSAELLLREVARALAGSAGPATDDAVIGRPQRHRARIERLNPKGCCTGHRDWNLFQLLTPVIGDALLEHEAAQYRAEAARARRHAEASVVPESRQAFVEIAERYERLAQWAERYGGGSRRAGQ